MPYLRAFSPLRGFMTEEEYTSVVENMTLPDGTLFGLPVVMDTSDEGIIVGDKLLLTYKGEVGPGRGISVEGKDICPGTSMPAPLAPTHAPDCLAGRQGLMWMSFSA